jgi:hypothetical protein
MSSRALTSRQRVFFSIVGLALMTAGAAMLIWTW